MAMFTSSADNMANKSYSSVDYTLLIVSVISTWGMLRAVSSKYVDANESSLSAESEVLATAVLTYLLPLGIVDAVISGYNSD